VFCEKSNNSFFYPEFLLSNKILTKMKRIGLFLITILALISSCTIRQEYHFNEDFSGTYINIIDMKMFNDFMASSGNETLDMGVSFKDSLQKYLETATAELEKVEGISNIKFGWNEANSGPFLSYDFRDIESLNNSIRVSGLSSEFSTMNINKEIFDIPVFTLKGKKLTYNPPKMEQVNELNGGEMKQMLDFYKYEVAFYFKNGVKKVTNDNVIISEDRKLIELKGNLFEMISPAFDAKVIMKTR